MIVVMMARTASTMLLLFSVRRRRLLLSHLLLLRCVFSWDDNRWRTTVLSGIVRRLRCRNCPVVDGRPDAILEVVVANYHCLTTFGCFVEFILLYVFYLVDDSKSPTDDRTKTSDTGDETRGRR